MNIESDPYGIWCIHYAKFDDIRNWNVMKLQRKDGVLVAAKTFEDVFKFSSATEAFAFLKSLYQDPELKYSVEVRRIHKAGETNFYVT
jgi:hypothetical protein